MITRRGILYAPAALLITEGSRNNRYPTYAHNNSKDVPKPPGRTQDWTLTLGMTLTDFERIYTPYTYRSRSDFYFRDHGNYVIKMDVTQTNVPLVYYWGFEVKGGSSIREDFYQELEKKIIPKDSEFIEEIEEELMIRRCYQSDKLAEMFSNVVRVDKEGEVIWPLEYPSEDYQEGYFQMMIRKRERLYNIHEIRLVMGNWKPNDD